MTASPTLGVPRALGQRVLAAANSERDSFLRDLEQFVNIDSGTYTRDGTLGAGHWLGSFLGRLGGEVTFQTDPNLEVGDLVQAVFKGHHGPRLLLVGHFDTVFDVGTAKQRPFRIDGHRAYGPGVTDMKGGLVVAGYALKVLSSTGLWPGLGLSSITFLANPDEEISSPFSRPFMERAASSSDVCLVFECARPNGDIVSARNGSLNLRVEIAGRSAHAGVEPEYGRSAILESAHQVIALQAIGSRLPGVTANVGVIRGGSRSNVVPDSASYDVNLRAPSRRLMEAAEAEVRETAGRPTVEGTQSSVRELGRLWPMEKLEGTKRLADHAISIGQTLGFDVKDAFTRGSSDACTIAGLGVPTLDGLGPIGGLWHNPDEYIELDSLTHRIALSACLIAAIASDPAFNNGKPPVRPAEPAAP
jgi:glutamate carboxypeptidase